MLCHRSGGNDGMQHKFGNVISISWISKIFRDAKEIYLLHVYFCRDAANQSDATMKLLFINYLSLRIKICLVVN
jgi:hypothetical protein